MTGLSDILGISPPTPPRRRLGSFAPVSPRTASKITRERPGNGPGVLGSIDRKPPPTEGAVRPIPGRRPGLAIGFVRALGFIGCYRNSFKGWRFKDVAALGSFAPKPRFCTSAVGRFGSGRDRRPAEELGSFARPSSVRTSRAKGVGRGRGIGFLRARFQDRPSLVHLCHRNRIGKERGPAREGRRAPSLSLLRVDQNRFARPERRGWRSNPVPCFDGNLGRSVDGEIGEDAADQG